MTPPTQSRRQIGTALICPKCPQAQRTAFSAPGKANDVCDVHGWVEGVEMVPSDRLGMNTFQDVIETVLRCGRAVGQCEEGDSVDSFDVVGVIADLVESYVRDADRLRAENETLRGLLQEYAGISNRARAHLAVPQ